MDKYKCVGVNRNPKTNVIESYVLLDLNSMRTRVVGKKMVKQALISNNVEISNMMITSNGSLRTTERFFEHKYDEQIDMLINRCSLIGVYVEPIVFSKINTLYLANIKKGLWLLLIPDSVLTVENIYGFSRQLQTHIVKDDTLKVIGGKNIRVTDQIFAYLKFAELDLTEFDMTNLIIANAMFNQCKARKITFGRNSTPSLKSCRNMFSSLKLEKLDIQNFDTSQVTDMYGMFQMSTIDKLELGNFNTSNVTTMENMFNMSDIPGLDLHTFDTSKVKHMGCMFYEGYYGKTLDLSSLSARSLEDAIGMCENIMSDVINVKDKRLRLLLSHESCGGIKFTD